MIVLPKLQDLSETITPESSTSSGARGDSSGHHSSLSKGSSLEQTPSVGKGVGEGVSSPSLENVDVDVDVDVLVVAGWEGKTISGRLSNIRNIRNIRKAPQTLATGFRFRADLHHEVANGAASIKGINNDLTARLFGWRSGHTYMNYPSLTLDDLALKDKLPNYVKAEGLVDLEALVTLEALVVYGFVDVANLYNEACPIENEVPARPHSFIERIVETISTDSSRRAREDFDAKDDVPLIRHRLSFGTQSGAAFSHAIALFESKQGACGQNREQPSEMANKVASVESRADELANKVKELKEELGKAQAKKESRIQAAMDEVARVEDRTKKLKADRDNALNELNSLKQRMAMTNENLAHVEEGLRKVRSSHLRMATGPQGGGDPLPIPIPIPIPVNGEYGDPRGEF
ncbi:hypothetical protein SLEP1_g17253 [Rubroshorea leprosula]|uniref:Uncharacterized protein n=1 Tax=Rubroshorea leprosula TaxID=152421 RepID=A0AAV5IZH6_9ROSI|nr:hypothetical protein SLEP1_g17253 [Rubroshorea leprosula]